MPDSYFLVSIQGAEQALQALEGKLLAFPERHLLASNGSSPLEPGTSVLWQLPQGDLASGNWGTLVAALTPEQARLIGEHHFP